MIEQFENKKHVTVYFTNKGCPLAYTDLLTYCYRAHQDCYGEVPSHRRVAKRTGIREETVVTATERLQERGLLGQNNAVVTPCPHLDWFQPLDSLRQKFADDHFSKWLWNWRCYVRQPGQENPLTVPAVMTYSLIRHSVLGKWKPKEGWTYQYFSLVLGMTDKTVRNALAKLEQFGFLSVLEGFRFRLYRLRDSQLRCFADNQTFSGTASGEPDEVLDDFAPGSNAMEEEEAARSNLVQYLGRFPITHSQKQRIYQAVIHSGHSPKHWQELASAIIEKVID